MRKKKVHDKEKTTKNLMKINLTDVCIEILTITFLTNLQTFLAGQKMFPRLTISVTFTFTQQRYNRTESTDHTSC